MKILDTLKDDKYPYTYINHTRKIVRAFVFDKDENIALIRIEGKDIFGKRDYYETPGGGVKDKESLLEGLKREILEELGIIIDNIHPIGRIIDYYNLINRKNDNHYYFCFVKEKLTANLENYEKDIFKEVVWINIDTAIKMYEEKMDTDLGYLVGQRELIALRELKKIWLKYKKDIL